MRRTYAEARVKEQGDLIGFILVELASMRGLEAKHEEGNEGGPDRYGRRAQDVRKELAWQVLE